MTHTTLREELSALILTWKFDFPSYCIGLLVFGAIAFVILAIKGIP